MKVFLFNMGLPMIVPSVFLMALALIPVILLESIIVVRSLRLSNREVLPQIAIANLLSTFIGIPVTWLVMLLFEFVVVNLIAATGKNPWSDLFSVTIGSPWIAPRGGDEE